MSLVRLLNQKNAARAQHREGIVSESSRHHMIGTHLGVWISPLRAM